MKKIDQTVLRETKYIGLWVLVLSALMQAVFLIIGAWDYTALLGNLLSGGAGVLNFFLMGLAVQKAVTKEESDAKKVLRVSQLYRTFMMFLFVVMGVCLPCFHLWSVIIPLFFPRIAIAFRPVFDRK